MQFAVCNFASHGSQILEIFNDVILHSTALYDYKPRSIEQVADWFSVKELHDYPVIGAFEGGELVGFASYGVFRNFPAFKYTVEHSVYLASESRGKGLGKLLMVELIAKACQQQYHVMVGAIDAANTGSITMHQKLGFTFSGMIKQAGFKFDRWLDLAFYQLILETPSVLAHLDPRSESGMTWWWRRYPQHCRHPQLSSPSFSTCEAVILNAPPSLSSTRLRIHSPRAL